MPDLLDCLRPACHQASAVTTPTVAGVTFLAVVAVAGLVTVGADGVELLVRYQLCGHRGHAEEKSAK
jgi:hypothetical protein